MAVADLNGDGKLDLALGDSGLVVSVLLGKGDGTFLGASSFAAGSNPVSLAVADINGDRQPDVAVANYNADGTVSVLLSTCISAGPVLAILRSNTSVTVSWPSPSTGLVLESTISLRSANWQPVIEMPKDNNGLWEVIIATDQRERYFRLH